MVRRLTYIFIVIDIVLCAVAFCVYLLPPRQQTDGKALNVVTMHDTIVHIDHREQHQPEPINQAPSPTTHHPSSTTPHPSSTTHHPSSITQDISTISRSSPFYQEASKVLAGKLTEEDASSRRMILNYCEHLRTAYTTKDIDFIRQVFSEKALIIVGDVVKEQASASAIRMDQPQEKVQYFVRSKQQYLAHLSQAFQANKTIDVTFSGFRILRHPTMPGIYGVTLRQAYKSDRYSDDGRLFLLWDFRNPSMPLIHVRVWQPSASVQGPDDVIGLSDFNLE